MFSFFQSLIEKSYTNKKRQDLLSFFSPMRFSNFVIKKKVNKNFTLNDFLSGGGKNKSTQTLNDGILEEFELGDLKFIARLVHGEATDIKGHTHSIKFVSVDDINEKSLNCAVLNFDYQQKTAFVQSVGDFDNCVLCANRKFEYKVGQIMMLIMISICKRDPNIDFIELTDNTFLACMKTYKPNPSIEWDDTFVKHSGLNLKYISTLIKGETYYAKYGFVPKDLYDVDVLKHNVKIFAKKKLLNTIDIDKLVRSKITNKKALVVYEKYIVPLINKFNDKPACYFIKEFFNVNPDPYTKSVICYILEKIHYSLYDELEYKPYGPSVFIKYLND